MRKVVFITLAGLIFLGLAFSLQSPRATTSYAEGLGVDTQTPTASPTASPTGSPTTTTTATTTPTTSPSPTATTTQGPIRFPMIYRQPTLTPTATASPTRTPTTTATPTVTRTPTKTATGVPGATTLTGQLARTEPNKPSYATNIENVWVYEWIFNPTGHTINFGILGLTTTGPVNLPFKTSWDGAGAPGGQLQFFAGCHGPAGIPCAGSSDAGRHVDHVGSNPGENSPWKITQPGVYQMTLHVCYSTYTACQQPGQGVWQTLSGPVSFTAINWTPTPPADGQPQVVTPTPDFSALDYGPVCYLITDDPRGTYLSCPKPEAKHRPLIRRP